jgi:hypothetical protein
VRFRMAVEDAPLAAGQRARVKGRRVVVTTDARGVAAALVDKLTASGADARLVAPDAPLGALDTLVDLSGLDGAASATHSKALFARTREALDSGGSSLLSATAGGGTFGAGNAHGDAATSGGAAGLLKTVAKERTDVRVSVVDLDPRQPPELLADHLFAELAADDPLIEVGYSDGKRVRRRWRPGPSTATSPTRASTATRSSSSPAAPAASPRASPSRWPSAAPVAWSWSAAPRCPTRTRCSSPP